MDNDVLDEAYARLGAYGPEFAGRLSNHGPMVVEALSRTGQDDAIAGWVDWYLPRLEGSWRGIERVLAENWRDALGVKKRFADWCSFFEDVLQEAAWRDVVAVWCGHLAAGLSGSATHGVIRAAHAVMAMDQRDTPQRRGELCSALGYWAAVYTRLPERASPIKLPLAEALKELPLLHPSDQARSGWEQHVARLDGFAAVADMVVLEGEPSAALSDLTGAFAGLYLANSALDGRVIIPIHAVTCVTAVRRLMPYVSADVASSLLRFAWQAGAAISTAYAVDRVLPQVLAAEEDWESLLSRAVETRDEHAIKFVDACRLEDEIRSNSVYFAAAADACERLSC